MKEYKYEIGQRVRVKSLNNTRAMNSTYKGTELDKEFVVYGRYNGFGTTYYWHHGGPNYAEDDLELVVEKKEEVTKTNNMKQKQFKNNFGVKSDSPALIKAFAEEVEKLGWKYQSDGLGDRTFMYFNGNRSQALKQGCYWYPQGISSDYYSLPTQWDEAIRAASEVIRIEEEFKVGDYVVMVDAGGWSYSPKNNGCIAKVESVHTRKHDYSSKYITSISGIIINWKEETCLNFSNIPVYATNQLDPYTRLVIRKATEEEIKNIEFQEGDYVKLISHAPGSFYGTREIGSISVIRHKSESNSVGLLYRVDTGGSWYAQDMVKITEEEYRAATGITISGHTAKKEGDKIAFGCQSFSKQNLEAYKDLLQRREFTTKITINDTDITVDILNKLLKMLN